MIALIAFIDLVHIYNAVIALGYTTMPSPLTFIAVAKDENTVYLIRGNNFSNIEDDQFNTVFGITQTKNNAEVLLLKQGEFTASEVNEFYQDTKEKHRKSMWPWWRWIW